MGPLCPQHTNLKIRDSEAVSIISTQMKYPVVTAGAISTHPPPLVLGTEAHDESPFGFQAVPSISVTSVILSLPLRDLTNFHSPFFFFSLSPPPPRRIFILPPGGKQVLMRSFIFLKLPPAPSNTFPTLHCHLSPEPMDSAQSQPFIGMDRKVTS